MQSYYAASLHIDYPMLFELQNDAVNRVSHCGVLEFIAEEGMIYMPYWVRIYVSSLAICLLMLLQYFFLLLSSLPLLHCYIIRNAVVTDLLVINFLLDDGKHALARG